MWFPVALDLEGALRPSLRMGHVNCQLVLHVPELITGCPLCVARSPLTELRERPFGLGLLFFFESLTTRSANLHSVAQERVLESA